VIVELTDSPVSELPEEPPAPPPPIASSARPDSIRASSDRPASTRPAPKQPPAARRWLEKLDAGIANAPEAPVTRREGKSEGFRCVTGRMRAPQGRGFRPGRCPGEVRGTWKHLGELEARVRGSGRPGVGFGMETEASMMFGGAGDSAGEPIPPGSAR